VSQVAAANRRFWDELCGTHFARENGIMIEGPEDIPRFDGFYFDFYPYLKGYLDPLEFSGQRTLEIGLGFGTVGQYLAESGAEYVGLDLAVGPVRMMRDRLAHAGLPGTAVVGNALALPFPDASLDRVVAIGSLHHTGDLAGCIRELRRVVRPGGQVLVMVYNRFCYVQWLRWPRATLDAWRRERRGEAPSENIQEDQRFSFDRNEAGEAAPFTELTSTRRAHELFEGFEEVTVTRENCTNLKVQGRVLVPRRLLRPLLRQAGIDLYVHAVR
jgi:SAM-dependent methyltransferase